MFAVDEVPGRFLQPRIDGVVARNAFDGDGLVLRVYEPNGARGPVTLRFAEPVKAVERVNLLEEPEDGAIEPGDGGSAVTFDVRPFEVISLRIRR